MTSHAPRHPRRSRDPQAGFAIVAVLLLVALIATFGATYMRHTVYEPQSSPVSEAAVGAREVVQSGLQVGRQSLASGQGPVAGGAGMTKSVTNQKAASHVEIQNLGNDRGRISVQSLDRYGLGATVLAEAAYVPLPSTSHPDSLPRLSEDKINALLADSSVPKHWYSGNVTLKDQDIYGLVICEDGSGVHFDNVVVRGAIVSERVLSTDPMGDFGSHPAPVAIIDGNLRVTPGDFLPGVAVLLNDGVLTTTTSDARVQLDGDVIGYRITLQSPGAVNGDVAAVVEELGSAIDRPGHGRMPPDWAGDLDMGGTMDTQFMAFPPRLRTVADMSKIIDYWK